MVKWDELAKPKEHGGLGFTETRLMNVSVVEMDFQIREG
jgi:hypothetical protein